MALWLVRYTENVVVLVNAPTAQGAQQAALSGAVKASWQGARDQVMVEGLLPSLTFPSAAIVKNVPYRIHVGRSGGTSSVAGAAACDGESIGIGTDQKSISGT